MSRHLTRRRVLATGAAGVALSGITRRSAHAQDKPTQDKATQDKPATWAFLTPGFTVLVAQYIIGKALAQKHNVVLAKPTEYAAVSTYYNDFAAGNYDICIGSWDVLAARRQAGVPIKLLCTITTADMIFIVSGNPHITEPTQLRGRTLAAVQSTGTFRIVSALLKDAFGLDLSKDVTIQGVDNPAAAITLVMANRADAGLSWEPNISAGLARDRNLRPIFNAGEAYRRLTNLMFPYFAVGVREEWASRNPDAAHNVRQVFASCLAGLNGDTENAVRIAGSQTGFAPEVLADAITSRRLRFVYASMADEVERRGVVKASEFLVRYGLLPKPVTDEFFLTS
jgi:NitT/TauT family transport system substrate-binding protein